MAVVVDVATADADPVIDGVVVMEVVAVVVVGAVEATDDVDCVVEDVSGLFVDVTVVV